MLGMLIRALLYGNIKRMDPFVIQDQLREILSFLVRMMVTVMD